MTTNNEPDRIAGMSSPQTHELSAVGEFGRSATNPVLGDGGHYCARLWCQDGHPFWYHRLGSLGRGPGGHILDLMELECFGGEVRDLLIFDMYHSELSAVAPARLSLGAPDGLGTRVGRVVHFPDELFAMADGKPRKFVGSDDVAKGLTRRERFLGVPGVLAATSFGTMELL